MKYIKYLVTILLIIFAAAALRYFIFDNKYREKVVNLNALWSDSKISKSEKLCFDFINRKMTDKDLGIINNYANPEYSLSESEGLIMLYSAYTGNKKIFHKHFNIVKKKMFMKNGLIRWRISRNKKFSSNSSASIDDLRIIRALLLGYERWKFKEYKAVAKEVIESVANYEILDDVLVDYYDNGKAREMTLGYADFYTMKLLANNDKKWGRVFKKCKSIINKGYISNKLPLYRTKYYLDNNGYSKEKDADTLMSIITAYHIAETGQKQPNLVKWIKYNINKTNAIYSKYNIKTRKAKSSIESTAIYAVCARIAKIYKEKDLYKRLILKMKSYQIINKKSKIYGSFGDEINNQSFSFDNLQALIAFREKIDSEK